MDTKSQFLLYISRNSEQHAQNQRTKINTILKHATPKQSGQPTDQFPENTETKPNRNVNQIVNKYKLRTKEWEWCEVTAQNQQVEANFELGQKQRRCRSFYTASRMIGVSSTSFVQVSPKGTSHFTLRTRGHHAHAEKFKQVSSAFENELFYLN